MAGASGVLVGSRHDAELLWETIEDAELPAKTRLGPPGVDTRLFAPLDRAEAPVRLRELAADVQELGEAGLGRDGAASAAAIEHFAGAEGPRVVFVGKLIVSKGVDLLLAAWPLVHRANPGARLLLVGFGEYRGATERLLAALEAGDLDAAREIAAAGRGLEGGPSGPLRMLQAFLDSPPEGYADAARAAAGSVALGGRLEHEEVGRLVPAADAMVVPSTFPESFGMVAAEAAAAGVLPVCTGHSGLLEVAETLAEAVRPEIGRLLSFPLGDDAVAGIAERLNEWLALESGSPAGGRGVVVRSRRRAVELGARRTRCHRGVRRAARRAAPGVRGLKGYTNAIAVQSTANESAAADVNSEIQPARLAPISPARPISAAAVATSPSEKKACSWRVPTTAASSR